mmetsp:Transcript_20873/g.53849  ORF Transcript_20873/g.53849 Transcript_20873/m.53849 type:complete len:175 (-) Transcript_20873:230-754(-)|eukprot:CAMPEP_0119414104 /NCGR_PEP_ID=MMETSP1335-20130426/6496_1 /TAXON_ID=259385 /ORGANISM="Chrysoculter rhomboideus, Strain RCC1486" /LENGTH=174 /DNA_ID=CAMNT_0007438957 /DNA_START=29 /DNA_END=553 /DNA_ORIENTATION=-
MVVKTYQILGRMKPSEKDPNPKVYRMKLFAANDVAARSKFWYFISKLRRVKKAHGQILSCHELIEKNRRIVKNYGVWLRYESRTGTHNMYKEYRECSLNAAIQAVYNDLAGRNRAAPRGIQIIRTAEVKAASTKRPNVWQFLNSKIAFPLAHRVMRSEKRFKTTFKAQKPNTYY